MCSVRLFPCKDVECAPYVLLGLRTRWTCPDYTFVVRDGWVLLESNTLIGSGIVQRIVAGEM